MRFLDFSLNSKFVFRFMEYGFFSGICCDFPKEESSTTTPKPKTSRIACRWFSGIFCNHVYETRTTKR